MRFCIILAWQATKKNCTTCRMCCGNQCAPGHSLGTVVYNINCLPCTCVAFLQCAFAYALPACIELWMASAPVYTLASDKQTPSSPHVCDHYWYAGKEKRRRQCYKRKPAMSVLVPSKESDSHNLYMGKDIHCWRERTKVALLSLHPGPDSDHFLSSYKKSKSWAW